MNFKLTIRAKSEVTASKTDRGSALLSALFIMTLVAIAATAMTSRLQLDLYRARLILRSDQLYLASQGVTFWAMDVLKHRKTPFVALNQRGKVLDFPKEFKTLYPEVQTSGALYDLQALINLNNVKSKPYRFMIQQLFKTQFADETHTSPKQLLESIDYWISPYQPDRGQDEQLTYYLAQTPPYTPGYQALISPSEMRLIRGVNANLYQKLLPLICTLPEVTPINLNTAPKKILSLLGSGLNEAKLNEFIEERGETGWSDFKKMKALLEKFDLPRNQITLESQYFLSIGKTVKDGQSLTNYALLKRTKLRKKRVRIRLIREMLSG